MITTLLARRAAERPDAPLAVTTEGEYSYARLHDASLRFASLLAEQGIGEGDHVALIAGNGAAFLVAWFGINLRGAVAVTLNNQLLGEGMRYSIDQCDACLLVVDRAWADSRQAQLDDRQQGLPSVLIESDAAFLAQLMSYPPAEPVDVVASQACTIMYTSGTTGLPKGVVNCHQAYLAAGVATAKALAITPADRIMVFLPLFHVNPQMYAVMSALTTGAALVLLPKFSAASFFDDAIRLRATGCTFVGTVLSILTARHPGERKDHTLRFCFGGGAPKPVWEAMESRFGIKVHEVYGMTEVGGWTCGNTVAASRFGSVGLPRDDMEIRVVGADDRPLPPGEVGEILVRPREPDVILMGYYKKPQQTLDSMRNLWFHTGDLGSFDEDGYLYYRGRSKELIRKSGEMISPVEIETCLLRMPGVKDCAVVPVPDPITGDEIKAVVVVDDALEEALEHATVLAYLRERLAPFMLPRYLEFSALVPRTETEKIQRVKLQYLDDRVHDFKIASRLPTGTPS
jgi:acyl-CoA synthetase (AMP-forming)/AMP-acid ligase II